MKFLNVLVFLTVSLCGPWAFADMKVGFGLESNTGSLGSNFQISSPTFIKWGTDGSLALRGYFQYEGLSIRNLAQDDAGNFKTAQASIVAIGVRLEQNQSASVRPYFHLGVAWLNLNDALTRNSDSYQAQLDMGCDFPFAAQQAFFVQVGSRSHSKHADKINGSPTVLDGPTIAMGIRASFW